MPQNDADIKHHDANNLAFDIEAVMTRLFKTLAIVLLSTLAEAITYGSNVTSFGCERAVKYSIYFLC